MGHVYCISHADRYFKIGVTKNTIDKRLKAIQSSNPIKLELVWLVEVDDYRGVEIEVHKRLREFSVRGEWFAFSYEDAVNVRTLVEKLAGYNTTSYDIPITEKNYAIEIYKELLSYGQVSSDSRIECNGQDFRIIDIYNNEEITLKYLSNFIRHGIDVREATRELGLINH